MTLHRVLLAVSLLPFLSLTSGLAVAQDCNVFSGALCPGGEYCMSPEGDCEEGAYCTVIPAECPATGDPVCGCDGLTYANECEVHAAQMSIRSRGECPLQCGGNSGVECPEGEFCKIRPFDPGWTCAPYSLGGCAPIPEVCPDVWDPVCGCDGWTYANECEADRAGVAAQHHGECYIICGEPTTRVCPDGQFCRTDTHECADYGVCRELPSSCPADYDPVCGCDGITYTNECEAHFAGVSVELNGPCDRVCGGVQGNACGSGEYCKVQDGELGCGLEGVCEPVLTECPSNCRPVCGCDGTSYRNECEARAAGASIKRRGMCREVPHVRFVATDFIVWDAVEGASAFHVYRCGNPVTAGECLDTGAPGQEAQATGEPPQGGIWVFVVTADFPHGEGPPGKGSNCSPRAMISTGGN